MEEAAVLSYSSQTWRRLSCPAAPPAGTRTHCSRARSAAACPHEYLRGRLNAAKVFRNIRADYMSQTSSLRRHFRAQARPRSCITSPSSGIAAYLRPDTPAAQLSAASKRTFLGCGLGGLGAFLSPECELDGLHPPGHPLCPATIPACKTPITFPWLSSRSENSPAQKSETGRDFGAALVWVVPNRGSCETLPSSVSILGEVWWRLCLCRHSCAQKPIATVLQ